MKQGGNDERSLIRGCCGFTLSCHCFAKQCRYRKGKTVWKWGGKISHVWYRVLICQNSPLRQSLRNQDKTLPSYAWLACHLSWFHMARLTDVSILASASLRDSADLSKWQVHPSRVYLPCINIHTHEYESYHTPPNQEGRARLCRFVKSVRKFRQGFALRYQNFLIPLRASAELTSLLTNLSPNMAFNTMFARSV